MENLLEVLAILLFLVISGAQSVGKKMREQQKPQEEEKPLFEPTSMPPSRSRTAPSPVRPQPATPPPPVEEPKWTQMLREMLDMKEYKPEPVFEPVSSKKHFPKKKTAPEKKTQASVPPPPLQPVHAVTSAKPAPQTNPILESILKRAEKEPLRTSVLLSEILQPPLAKRADRRRI